MGLFDLFTNSQRKLDAILSYDASRNAGRILITSNIATTLHTLELYLTKQNDEGEWVDSFLYSLEYSGADDDAGEEYKDIEIELTPGIPYSIDFSLDSIAQFTVEKISLYFTEARNDGSFEEEDMERFFEAFLDPKWELEVAIDGVNLGKIAFEHESEKVREFIHSLSDTTGKKEEEI